MVSAVYILLKLESHLVSVKPVDEYAVLIGSAPAHGFLHIFKHAPKLLRFAAPWKYLSRNCTHNNYRPFHEKCKKSVRLLG